VDAPPDPHSPDAVISLAAPRYAGLDWLATMVLITTADGTIVAANSAAEDRLLASRQGLFGSRLAALFDEAGLVAQAIAEVAARKVDAKRLDATLHPARRDGGAPPVPVQLFVTRIDGHDEIVVELIEFEQQAKLVREERQLGLSQANKELVRNLAHEIRNPLGGIRGAAQLLQLEIEADSRSGGAKGGLAEYTQVIIAEADRLQSLVDRLLAPHRRQQLIADVNIHEVLERVAALISAEFANQIEIVRDYDISLPEFRGDKEQLIQAMLNIAQNAAQALAAQRAEGTAQIVFQTRIARQITFNGQRHRLALDLHIIDNGPGVPDEIRDRIFYPLVSGREGGSGLGLTLAQTFVHQHDGVIECESQPGKTDFRVLIPLH
jgi:two-component system nitrogen regulation sensor histidine kinase GlnL